MIKFILSIVILMLSLAFAYLYVQPEYYRMVKAQANVIALNDTLKSTETIEELVKQIVDNLKGLDPEDANRALIFLPETIDEIRFANNLQNIGSMNGIVLVDIKVGENAGEIEEVTGTVFRIGIGSVAVVPKKASLDTNKTVDVDIKKSTAVGTEKKYAATRASFYFVTTYEKFLNLLDDLENSLEIINITSLSFQEHKEALSDTLLYRYTVEIETYSLK